MDLLSTFFRRSRTAMVLAVIAGILSGAATTGLLALINAVLRGQIAPTSVVVGVFVGLCVIRLASGISSHVLLVRLSQNAIFELRTNLCRQIAESPLQQLEKVGPDRLMAAFGEDMLQLANVVINLPYMFVNWMILTGCLLYLGWLSWTMLCGIGICLGVGAASYLLPVTRANRRLRLARGEQDRLFGHFRALTEGAKELKLHRRRREEFLSRVLIPTADAVRRHNTVGITIYSSAANWGRLLFFVYVGLLLFLAPSRVPVTSTALAGYIIIVLYMMAPLEAVMNVLPHLAQANVALQHIQRLNASLPLPETGSATEMTPVDTTRVELELRGVTYRYQADFDDREFMLGPLNLTLCSGQAVFLIGGNGSGKTTLAKLISGLYLPNHGQFHLNGLGIDSHNQESYRQQFAVVFNDFYLFDVLLGLDLPRLDARAGEYLVQLQLDHKLSIEKGTFSTIALSQGQRKRLALLVALLEDRPIYVFDEWAADQDPQFKRVFYDQILPDLKARGKAILVITHDDRYFDRADRILKLEEGKLVDMPQPVGLGEDVAGSRVGIEV